MLLKPSNEQRRLFEKKLFDYSHDFFTVVECTDDDKIHETARNLFLDRVTKLLLTASQNSELDINGLSTVDKNGTLTIGVNAETVAITKQGANFELIHNGMMQISHAVHTAWDQEEKPFVPLAVTVNPENQNYPEISSLYDCALDRRIEELQSDIETLKSYKSSCLSLESPEPSEVDDNSNHKPLVKTNIPK